MRIEVVQQATKDWEIMTYEASKGEIPLTQGRVARVSPHRVADLMKYNWYAKSTGTKIYAARDVRVKGKRVHIMMHRDIMKAPMGKVVDHINGDSLDNRDENLRVVDIDVNNRNTPGHANGRASQYKGVHYDKRTGHWRAQIMHRHIGAYPTEEKAAEAYDIAARKFFGDAARLNFPGKKYPVQAVLA